MKNFIQRFKEYYWREYWKKFLRNRGFGSWKSFLRYNDPDFNIQGQTVEQMFFGYKNFVRVDPKYIHWTYKDDGIQGVYYAPVDFEIIENWCEQNCKNKFRWQFVRSMNYKNVKIINDMFGEDDLYFGFKDEKDCLLFLLRWS